MLSETLILNPCLSLGGMVAAHSSGVSSFIRHCRHDKAVVSLRNQFPRRAHPTACSPSALSHPFYWQSELLTASSRTHCHCLSARTRFMFSVALQDFISVNVSPYTLLSIQNSK